MDGFLRRHASRVAGFALALLALASLLSFKVQDPTLTNLRYPKDGVGNWLGYPGALLGGSLVEGFGLAALVLPLLIANLFLASRNRPALHRYALHGGALLLIAAAALGLGGNEPALGLRGPGLVGWSAGRWLLDTAGRWPGAALLALAGLYAAAHLVYAPQVARALADARTLIGFGARTALARLRGGWRAWRPQTGWAWHELPLLPVHAAMFAGAWLWERGVRRTLVRPVTVAMQGWRERRYSVARVKAGPAAPSFPAAAAPPEPAPRIRPLPDPELSDGFDRWLEHPEPVSAAPPTPPAPMPAPTPPPAAARPAPPPIAPQPIAPLPRPVMAPLPTEEGARAGGDRTARWEEYLRRYQENLDLDWDERSWKRKRLEELAQDEAEEPPAAAEPLKPKEP